MPSNLSNSSSPHNRMGRSLTHLPDSADWNREAIPDGDVVLESSPIDCGLPANEFIVSWNAVTPPGTGITVEARALFSDHNSPYYTLGHWALDSSRYPRTSVKNQKDTDAEVQTDTLVLSKLARKVQVRVTLHSAGRAGATTEENLPSLKLVTICAADSHVLISTQKPEKLAWGKEITVPGRTQLGWPDANGWCSPTSTDMVLAFWAQKLKRPELDLPVPDVAHAIYDSVYEGTGNWPFNTAFAGSFPGIDAYVSRFADVSELEMWIDAGTPPIVSVSYDLLKGKDKALDPGHLMVCVGFTAEGDIVLNDPAHHPEKGEACRRVFPRSSFIKAWAHSGNAVYLIYAHGSKLPKNTYGHW